MEEKNEPVNFTGSIGADGKERPRHVARPIPEPARHVALFGAAYAVCPPALRERLRQADARAREARGRAMPESEQQARRDLETRLLPAPAPRPAPAGKGRLWALVILLLATLAFAGWHWRDAVMAALAP